MVLQMKGADHCISVTFKTVGYYILVKEIIFLNEFTGR